MLEFILLLFAIVLSAFFSVLITQPFNGALVRLRANYLPKAVSLDNVLEDGGTGPRAISAFILSQRRDAAKIGPVVSGMWQMFLRTKRLEGWAGGVYKGSAPVVLQLFLLSAVTFVIFGVRGSGGMYGAAPANSGDFRFWSNLIFMLFMTLVALPLTVITNRTLVHPRPLPLTTPRENLRELLSYSEFNQPWRLFLLPGLLPATFAHVFWVGMVSRIVRQLTVPSLGGLPPSVANPGDESFSAPDSRMMQVSYFGLAIFILWNVLSVIVLAPLECAMVRLSVQRPERQQPLHLAYAQRNRNAGPSSHSHQATADLQNRPGGTYSDDSANGTNSQANNKPLPQSPQDADSKSEPLSRPSFAIEDDEEDEGDSKDKKVKVEDGNQDDEQQPPREDAAANDSHSSPLLNEVPSSSSTPSTTPTAPHEPNNNTSSNPTRVLGGHQSNSNSQYPSSNFHHLPTPNTLEPHEPVIALRPCDEPRSAEEAARIEAEEFGAPVVERYTGLRDCLRKMIDEEGMESLGRGAWVTLLGVLVGSFT